MKICLQSVQIEIHLACHFDSAFADKSVFQDRIDYRFPFSRDRRQRLFSRGLRGASCNGMGRSGPLFSKKKLCDRLAGNNFPDTAKKDKRLDVELFFQYKQAHEKRIRTRHGEVGRRGRQTLDRRTKGTNRPNRFQIQSQDRRAQDRA